MKKIEAKVYGNTGWIITSDDGDIWGFVWNQSFGHYPFRYETFGHYSHSGFGNSLEECMKYISDEGKINMTGIIHHRT